MKRFDNVANDNSEKALRRGYVVPPGGVNLAWVKSPPVSPENNIVVIDTSRVAGENAAISTKEKELAYADYLGVLQDENGNQIWDEEFPVISDVFLPDEGPKYGDNFTDDDILPFCHISRHFHVDFIGITQGPLVQYGSHEIRVIDKNGSDFTHADGKKRYKIFLAPVQSNYVDGSRDGTYRVYVFLDTNPGIDELYLTYNKVEIAANGGLRNQQIDWKETINPRPYYKYVPEESDVVDHTMSNQKIYSTKPVNVKQKALNLPQNNYQGWKVYVPRKAIPDPRIFQLFRWRLACEFNRPVTADNDTVGDFTTTATIKVGIVVPANGNYQHTRANYLFYQLNHSDYNFSKVKFVNPMKTPNGMYSETEQRAADYWHVDINSVSLEDISKFDILVWAPASSATNVAPYLPKLEHFVENMGGTLIFETSSWTDVTGLYGFTFSPRLPQPVAPASTDNLHASSLRLYDATASNPNDEFSSYGMWKSWPPKVSEIMTNYTDTGSILADAGTIAGWNLTEVEENDITVYNEIPQFRFQYITAYPNGYRPVLEGQRVSDNNYKPTMVHKKFASGGNIFVSTSGLFEDHLFEPSGDMIMRTMNLENFNDLNIGWRTMFDPITSAFVAAAEMKLRFNTMMLATVFKPSPKLTDDLDFSNDADAHTMTVYTDWQSSWVINAANGVLTDEEIDQHDFVLQTHSPTQLEPNWQRRLSTKTVGQLIQEKLHDLDPNGTNPAVQSFSGAAKRYMVICTNPRVQVPNSENLHPDSLITAWTDAYSPKFEVPYYQGPYDIRDEMVAGTGVGPGKRVYPPKSFALQAKATYLSSAAETTEVESRIQLTATVKRLLRTDDPNITSRVWIPGVNTSTSEMRDTVLFWTVNGTKSWLTGYQHQWPMARADGINTWADANYKITRTNNWPYWGRNGTYSENRGNRGTIVVQIQKLLNQFITLGYIVGPRLAEDGYYGSVTAAKIRTFQIWKGAQYIDGIIDAETWSLLGMTLVGTANGNPSWATSMAGTVLGPWINDAKHWLAPTNISDNWPHNAMTRQSWYTNGPSKISNVFHVQFSPNDIFAEGGLFRIYQVSILPHTDSQYLDWLDVGTRSTMTGWTPGVGYPGPIAGRYGNDNQWIHVPINETRANSVLFQLSSTKYIGQGTSRMIGVRDVAVYAKRLFNYSVTNPGYWQETTVDPGTVTTVEKTDVITYEARMTFKAGTPVVIDPMDALAGKLATIMASEPTERLISQSVSSIRWNIGAEVFTSDPAHASYFDVVYTDRSTADMSRNDVSFTFNGFGLTVNPLSYLVGPEFGKGANSYYTCTESRVVDPYPQIYGWVSKDDGVKLICDAAGNPYGFPANIPSQTSNNIHFANYIVDASNRDQTTYCGFYDVARKEWVTNASGEPQMSYYDYIRRGPNNVYLAAMTTYELDITSNLPSASMAINRPFKWAMPVYGVTRGAGSKIQIAPMNPNLGSKDIWAVPIRTGTFSRTTTLKGKSTGSYTNYLADYQGSNVTAFYNVPEANEGPWSKLYGRPYADIENELPIVIDDDAIQVRRAPILTVQEPTATPSITDPWVPAFTVFVRATIDSAWVEQSLSDIKDYDLVRGIITLNSNLPANDPRLVKVNYTSEAKVYNFKWDGTNKLNLNPYINGKPEWSNKPIYIYLLPEYVTDSDYNVIAGTQQTRTLRMTLDSSVFTQSQAAYNPLALLLGVVYITTDFDLAGLSILDTRRRGGGISTSWTDEDAIAAEPELEDNWDVLPRTATSFQKGGFVIIRMPANITSVFSEEEILEVIERNITAGVRYQLEDHTGDQLRWDLNPNAHLPSFDPANAAPSFVSGGTYRAGDSWTVIGNGTFKGLTLVVGDVLTAATSGTISTATWMKK